MSLLLMEPAGKNVEFAAVMERIAAGRSSRELHRITIENGDKISHSSIADARWGMPPSQKLLVRMLKALNASEQDTLEALRAADFIPKGTAEAELALSGADAFYEEFRRLQADYPHLPIPLPHFSGGVRSIKGPDEAREIVAGMRRRVEQGLFGDPRRPDEGKG